MNESISRLEQISGEVRAQLQLVAAELERVRHSRKVHPDAAPEVVQRVRAEMQTEMGGIRARASERIAELRAEAEELTPTALAAVQLQRERALARGSLADPTAALHRETREIRLWARYVRGFDREERVAGVLTAADQLLRAALARGDEDTVATLAAELPSYLQARFDAKAGEAAQEQLEKSLAAATPRVAQKLAEAEVLSRGIQRVRVDTVTAADALSRGLGQAQVLGWDADDAATVNFDAEATATQSRAHLQQYARTF